ncbi:MAG: hypothetical protein GXO04_04530, partial [Aquificae bacterium]|nr:hypothetical protein [Aquificota bacterium]
RFPEICFINNTLGTLNFGLYKGLRKLKGEDVLVVDGGKKLAEEKLRKLPITDKPSILLKKGSWEGLAYIPKREIYYVVKSLERTLEDSITRAFALLKNSYGINYVALDISN